jgi:hypothetical protein
VTCLNELISNLHLGEGRWERPYRDHLGYLAIGWGFLIDERKSVALPRLPLRITQDLQAPPGWSALRKELNVSPFY